MLVFPYASRQQRLRAFVRTAQTVHLFTNDAMPTAGSVAADFVEPDAATGYAPIQLLKAGWRFEAVGPAIRALAAPVLFTLPTGRALVRGNYAVNADGDLLWAEVLTMPGPDGEERPTPFEFLRPTDALEIRVMVDSLDLQATEAADA